MYSVNMKSLITWYDSTMISSAMGLGGCRPPCPPAPLVATYQTENRLPWHWGAAAPLAPLRHSPRTLNTHCKTNSLAPLARTPTWPLLCSRHFTGREVNAVIALGAPFRSSRSITTPFSTGNPQSNHRI